jgi:hypothetical protein
MTPTFTSTRTSHRADRAPGATPVSTPIRFTSPLFNGNQNYDHFVEGRGERRSEPRTRRAANGGSHGVDHDDEHFRKSVAPVAEAAARGGGFGVELASGL